MSLPAFAAVLALLRSSCVTWASYLVSLCLVLICSAWRIRGFVGILVRITEMTRIGVTDGSCDVLRVSFVLYYEFACCVSPPPPGEGGQLGTMTHITWPMMAVPALAGMGGEDATYKNRGAHGARWGGQQKCQQAEGSAGVVPIPI